jgi:histidinol phosphatase-like PHP family hydrolase
MQYPQDLHIHTTWSRYDSAIVPQQTLEMIAQVQHADVIGISDHLEHIKPQEFEDYRNEVKQYGFHVGVEVDGPESISYALDVDPEYFVYHCYDREDAYNGAEQLLETRKPVIIAHPLIMNTNLDRVPTGCIIEISNRYVWRSNWPKRFKGFTDRFQFVFSSDAHQPLMLNQTYARFAARAMGVEETILFPKTEWADMRLVV